MKPRAALPLILALGCFVSACAHHPPSSSSWHIIEAPRRPCTGPSGPWLRSDCLHHRPNQCFETSAPLSKWSRVSVRRWWQFAVVDFDSSAECYTRLRSIQPHSPPVLFGAEPVG